MSNQEESIANTILSLAPEPSNTYTAVQLTPNPSGFNHGMQPSEQFPDTSMVIHQNQTTQECIEIPITIRETKHMEVIYDDIAQTPDTPNPDDISIDEAKIHLFNAYTVCLDGEGPVLTLKQVQMRTAAYISEYDNWKLKYPPKLLFLLCICLGIASYGLVSMISSNFNDQLSLMVTGVGGAGILILCGCILSKHRETHEDFVEYYHRKGYGLRFDTEGQNIERISYEVDYGFEPDKKGEERFKNLHDGTMTEEAVEAVCGFGDVLSIGREIVKRRDKPDRCHIYINYKGGLEWKSEMGHGKGGKLVFGELKSVMKMVDENWLNRIYIKKDKIIKG